MRTLTKRQEEHYKKAYINATATNLYQCYKKPSNRKLNSFNMLLDWYKSNDDLIIINYKILSYNVHQYTLGIYTYNDMLKKNVLYIETANNSYSIVI